MENDEFFNGPFDYNRNESKEQSQYDYMLLIFFLNSFGKNRICC